MKKMIALAALIALFVGCKKNEPAAVELKGISFAEESVSIEKGGQKALSLVFTPADVTDKSVTWLTSNPAVATVSDGIVTGVGAGQADISAKAGVYTATCKVTVTITLKGIQLEKEISLCRDETATLTAMLDPSDATADITWESSDETVVTVKDGELTGVGVGTATVTAKAGSIKAECAVTILPPKGAVDLGIELTREDGTTYKLYWAECNLGAEKPDDYGDYYAWGETAPKSDYSWETYKWCNGASNKLTKYCNKANTDCWDGEGSPDGKTVLDPEDDAAHVQLGGKWRMPTMKEMEALLALKSKEDYTWEEFGEVAGVRITRKSTGAVLLLPAAGYRDNTSVLSAKLTCQYWSSTGFLGGAYMGPYDATVLFFRKGATIGSGTAYDPRNRGFSIRPVTE
ncbi:MAG: Ig domain-containing protein [Bacteroidales bacterium]|nr:Ig domain-containing protein [Bacteroidales bacterium]